MLSLVTIYALSCQSHKALASIYHIWSFVSMLSNIFWIGRIFFFFPTRIDTRDLIMVVTTLLIDMLVLSMMYDVSRSLQRELNYQLCLAAVTVWVPHLCSCSKEGSF